MTMNPLIHLLHGAAQPTSQRCLAPRRIDHVLNTHTDIKATLYRKIKRRMLPAGTVTGKDPGMTDYDTIKRGLAAARRAALAPAKMGRASRRLIR